MNYGTNEDKDLPDFVHTLYGPTEINQATLLKCSNLIVCMCKLIRICAVQYTYIFL